MKAFRQNLLLALVSTLLVLAAGEIFLRIRDRETERSGWRYLGPQDQTNQLGLRGRPIDYGPDDFVVVLVGDSHVEAEACSYYWLPEARLEHHLRRAWGSDRVRVFSVAARGWGQDQQLLALEEYYANFRADLVLIWETPQNDVWNNAFPTHWPANGWPKPTFRLDGDELVGPTEAFGAEIPHPPVRVLGLVQDLLGRERRVLGPNDRDGYWERHLPAPYRPLDDPGDGDAAICEKWQRSRTTLVKDENLATEKSHFALLLTPHSERTRYGLDLGRALLDRIAELVRRNGGRLLAFHATTDGHEWPTLCPEEEGLYPLDCRYYRTSKRQLEENVAYLNGDIEWFEVPVTIDLPFVSPTDGHLNEHGTDQVMRDVAEGVARRVPRPAP